MDTVGFFLASFCPAILLILRQIVLRRLSIARRLVLDLVILVVSLPTGMELVAWAVHFPDNLGDHSPGIGVAWALLLIVWFICFLIWLVRLAIHAFDLLHQRHTNSR